MLFYNKMSFATTYFSNQYRDNYFQFHLSEYNMVVACA